MGFINPKQFASRIRKKEFLISNYMRLFSDDNQIAENHEIRKGYVPVVVGNEELAERFMIQTRFMKHPLIISLLELSADEFGYEQEGVLRIPCEPEFFPEISDKLCKMR